MAKENDTIKNNPHFNLEINEEKLKSLVKDKWIEKNTAILIVHGIGHQNPLETLDQFGRGIAETFLSYGNIDICLTHEIVKRSNNEPVWFDNFIRIRNKKNNKHLDIYEYYWANFTEDKAKPKDFQKWVSDTAKGARKFYKQNAAMTKKYEHGSPFLNAYEDFNYYTYFIFLYVLGGIIPIIGNVGKFGMTLLTSIPFFGTLISGGLKWFINTTVSSATNVVNDIVIYNTYDKKSKFFQVRKKIMEGAIKQLRYLVESHDEKEIPYEKVVIAGHSLGTQVAFDAINELTHLVNEGEIKGYTKDGIFKGDNKTNIAEVLSGLVTFGSPLDKIAFFLRENVEAEKEYLRFQILCNYHSFKQRDWAINFIPEDVDVPPPFRLAPAFNRIFDNLQWRNYYDNKDYVSGALDYYYEVNNINCRFKTINPFAFTHSWYWDRKEMYADIILTML
jgi:hypothetical protein